MSYNPETKMWEGYIYIIENSINDKVYIGQTRKTVKERLWEHKTRATRQQKESGHIHLYNAMNQLGRDNFTSRQLEKLEAVSKARLTQMLNRKEKELISNYSNQGFELYNMTAGGDFMKDGACEKRVIQYDLQCNRLKEYPSSREAAEKLGVSYSTISGCCNKRTYSAGGYIWRFLTDPLVDQAEIAFLQNKFKGGHEGHPRKVVQYDTELNYIATFRTITEASKITGLSAGSISCVCRNKMKTTGGYIFRYDGYSLNDYPFKKDVKLKDHHTHKPTNFVPVEQRNRVTGELICVHQSMKAAAQSLNKHCESSIKNCCDRKLASSGGYCWCRVGEFDPEYFDTIRLVIQKYNVYTMSGEYIDTLTETQGCLDFLGKTDSRIMQNIRYACDGTYKQAYGYKWRYA